MKEDVILVNIIKTVTENMAVTGYPVIHYEAGNSFQILKSINDFDNSITYKDKKYPLIAMVLPVREKRGSGYYATVTIPRIVIATLSNNTDDVFTRYVGYGTFKKVLYPCYYEFLTRLAQSPNIIGSDPDSFVHTKMDSPGIQQIGTGISDYIDSIEILNLEIILNQIKTC